MSATGDDSMAALMAGVWRKSRAEVLRRVGVVESAAAALRKGPLEKASRAEAMSAAHQIAGIGGSFGYWDATELAREAEAMLEGDSVISPEQGARLREIAETLHTQLSAPPPA